MASITTLEPGRYYHIYNRGNNRENLFREARNYEHFLTLYAHHVTPAAETFAYCLMRNHFHLLVRIRDAAPDAPERSASRCFSNFFNAYTKAFNGAYQRTGALFQRPFKRIEVGTEPYLYRLVTYIHQNPQRHGFVADFRDWPYSSYPALLSERPTRLNRPAVLDWFGGRENVSVLHQLELPDALVNTFAPDDFGWSDVGQT
jgi:putative transposase